MTEELEQLMKNLRLKRMIEIYAEQLKTAEKEDISYSEFLVPALARRVAFPSGTIPESAHQTSAFAGSLDAGNLPVQQTARSQSATNPRLRRTGLHSQGGKYCVYRQKQYGQDRPGFRHPAEGSRKRLSRSVHPCPGSFRRNVCIPGRSFLPQASQSPRETGRTSD